MEQLEAPFNLPIIRGIFTAESQQVQAMAHNSYYRPLMFFVIKISILTSVYYYFSIQINLFADQADIVTASAYSAAYAVIVLAIMLLFRWNGFFTRLLAGLIGITALGAVIGLHILTQGFINSTFIGIYFSIFALAILLGYVVLFKKG